MMRGAKRGGDRLEPGDRIEIAPWQDGRFHDGLGRYDGEEGRVLARVLNGKVKVTVDGGMDVPRQALRRLPEPD